MTFDSAKDLLPKPNWFYCAICNQTFDTELTSTAGLDDHILHVHGRNPNKDNGKADLERDSLKAHGVAPPRDYANYFNV